jgi:prephenate dehydrogenase
MARSNRTALLHALQGYRHSLAALEQLVQQGEWSGLQGALQVAQQLRPEFVQPDRSAG